MSSVAADIADAIVADLNAGSFSQSFTAVRKWIVKWDRRQLSTLRVTVIPGGATYEIHSRGRDDQRHDMDIAVQKAADPSDNSTVDALLALLEEFVAHFRAKTLTAGSKRVECLDRAFIPGARAGISQEHLEDLRVFTGVLRTTWIVKN